MAEQTSFPTSATASSRTIEHGDSALQPTSNTGDACDTVSSIDPGDLECTKIFAPVTISQTESPEGRKESLFVANDKIYHQGIYWRSPISMVAFLLLAVFMSVGHHLYYSSLVGQVVGNVNDQQNALRYGTTFAFLVQISLITSVGYSYTQVLWRTLKHREVSIKALDDAFAAQSTLLSFLNPEMLWKIKLGSLIVLIGWCVPISALITPATLFVNPSSSIQNVTAPVRCLNISGTDQTTLFTYSVPIDVHHSNNTASQIFLGPRTIIARLSVATATLGEILPITPPFANSSYQIQFYGPTVTCTDANSTITATMDNLVQEQMSAMQNGALEMVNFYFAFVPEIGGRATEAILANRFQQPANASNQLWLTFQRYVIDTNGSRVPEPRHLVCQLYNASYDLSLEFTEGSQNITLNSLTTLNEVDYPTVNPTVPSDHVQHAYSAYMWAFTDQLIGSIGIYNDTSLTNSSGLTEFSEIKTQIEHTGLLGSSDLDYFFDQNHALFSNSTSSENSVQRLQDITLARNQTLDVLIAELAYNTTLSFMTSDLLSPTINTTVQTTTSINLYAYHSKNLFLAYGLAIAATLLASLFGGLAYRHNDASHNMSFSSILSSTRDPRLAELFHHQVLGKLPLPAEIERVKLKFGPMREGKGGLGFHIC